MALRCPFLKRHSVAFSTRPKQIYFALASAARHARSAVETAGNFSGDLSVGHRRQAGNARKQRLHAGEKA
jgi:hypothetical protein